MKTNETKTAKLANHREFYNARLQVRCEEKNGSLYWYGYDDSKLKKVTVRTSRGCGRLSRYVGNPWKRISKKVAAEILAKYDITVEQFIAYTNEEPELMNELAAQKAEEERQELLAFFLSTPLASIDAATEAEIEMSEMASKSTDNAVEAEIETQKTDTAGIDVKPYAVQIKMFGNKVPMFSITANGQAVANKRRTINWRKKEVDEWVLKAYEMRSQYPNMTIEVQEEVAVLHLDSFACNPHIVRELNVTLTGMTDYERRQIEEYEKSFIEAQPSKEIELPSGDFTVSSGAEAFGIVASYFPNGIEFDGIDYGWRGEKHFCFYSKELDMSVIAMSDEKNSRIEMIEVVNHKESSSGGKSYRPLSVRIAPPRNGVAKEKTEERTQKTPAPAKKVPDKAERWLANAKVDEAGRYYLVPEISYKNYEANANWNPCFYILTNDLKLRRLGLKFAIELAKQDKATEISKNNITTLKK